MTTSDDMTSAATGPGAVFSRVLVGVDGSAESREAVRQAAALVEGELTLLAVYDTVSAYSVTTGTIPSPLLDPDVQRAAAEGVLREAEEALGPIEATAKVARGCSWDELLDEADRERDTLVVVGTHGTGRVSGILMGSTATEVIHKARCSVLVAREARNALPRSIAVGVDGSADSALAHAVARDLAKRLGAKLRPIVAEGGKKVDPKLAATIAGADYESFVDDPVTALVVAAAEVDLLVVGSRGLHGVKSLGSVSERVAHRARSSVLIVREPAWQEGSR